MILFGEKLASEDPLRGATMTLPPMQLHMVLSNVTETPPTCLSAPGGYCLRKYRRGDEAGILTVLAAAGFDDWDMERLIGYLEAPERATRAFGTMEPISTNAKRAPVKRTTGNNEASLFVKSSS